MTNAIRILVTLAENADSALVEQALRGDSSLEVVGYIDHLEDWRAFLEQPGDLVVVACYGHDDGVAAMVDHAVKHRPDRPVVVMSEASPNGFLRPREARPAPDQALVRRQGADRADAAGPGQRRFDRVPPGRLRLAADDVRRGDRGHAARIHPGGDRDDRRLGRDLHGRDARLALTQ